MRLRQLPVDNSIVEITCQQNSWQVQLVIPRDDGTRLNLVGIQTSTLDEAKEIAARAMRHENPKAHVFADVFRMGRDFEHSVELNRPQTIITAPRVLASGT